MKRLLIAVPLALVGLGGLLLGWHASAISSPSPSLRPPEEVVLPPPPLEGEVAARRIVADRKPSGTLFGRILGPGGVPVTGAAISVLQVQPHPCGTLLARTDEDGRFWIDGIPPFEGTLHIQHPRYRPLLRGGIVLRTSLELNLLLEAGSTLSGRVLDDFGLPLEGVSVIATNEIARTGQTDAEGRFSVFGLGDGSVTLTAIASGFVEQSLSGLAPGSDHAEIRLSPGGTLSGAVEVDPLPRSFTVHLTARVADRGTYCRVRTQTFPGAPSGEFRFPDLAVGVYGVEVEAPGFEILDLPQVVVSPKWSSDGTRIRLRRTALRD